MPGALTKQKQRHSGRAIQLSGSLGCRTRFCSGCRRSHLVFKAPLRMVRTNKAKNDEELEKPKSRLVVPGHLGSGVGRISY